ncbi:hypothetical protein [Gordonia polyisoprenivorans]|uniref:hypothetical protein n=1 Tax=Gordonia polyisoprenivorans TaxID=84595 RepID=UPI001B8C58CF|nr:hypothetical protein [Gordonia polyisoprenivorans]
MKKRSSAKNQGMCPRGLTLDELEQIAVKTLGHQVHDSKAFRRHCIVFGLGDALNIEHDVIP